MARFLPLVMLSLCLVSSVLSDGLPHYIATKSFDTGMRECAQYFLIPENSIKQIYKQGFPNTENVKKLIRCTLLNLDAYDDATGPLDYVLGNYFKPCPSDTEFADRTNCCVKKALDSICPNDVFSRAYASFMCYYREYGNLVSDEQFVPNTLLELTQLMVFVESALNLPCEVLVEYSKGNILNDPNFPNVLYVWAVRGGYYTVDEGIQLDVLYTQYGLPEFLSPQTQQCAADVVKNSCNADNVTIMYNTFINCLQTFLPFVNLVQSAAQQQLQCKQSCPASGACVGTPQ